MPSVQGAWEALSILLRRKALAAACPVFILPRGVGFAPRGLQGIVRFGKGKYTAAPSSCLR